MKTIKRIVCIMLTMILVVSSVSADSLIDIPSNRAYADDVEVEISGADGLDVTVEKISGDLLSTYIQQLSEKNGFEFEPSLAIDLNVMMDGEPYHALPLLVSVKYDHIHGQLWHLVDGEWILCDYTLYENMAVFEASSFSPFIFGSQKAESEQDISFDEHSNENANANHEISLNSDIDDNKEVNKESELGELESVVGAGSNSNVQTEIDVDGEKTENGNEDNTNQTENNENEADIENKDNEQSIENENDVNVGNDQNIKNENDENADNEEIRNNENNQADEHGKNDENIEEFQDENKEDTLIENQEDMENDTHSEELINTENHHGTENDQQTEDEHQIENKTENEEELMENNGQENNDQTVNENIENNQNTIENDQNDIDHENSENNSFADIDSIVSADLKNENDSNDTIIENRDKNESDSQNADHNIDNPNNHSGNVDEQGDGDTKDEEFNYENSVLNYEETNTTGNKEEPENDKKGSDNRKGGTDTSNDTGIDEEIIDELVDDIPDGMTEAPELTVKGLRGARPLTRGGEPEDSNIEIKNLTIQWLSKSTGESEKAGFGTLRTVTKSDTLPNMQFQIDYTMDGNGELPPGAIEIVIPAYIFKTRDGKEMGELTLSVPEDPSYGAEYAWRRSGDTIILTNTHTLAVSSKVMIQGTWRNHMMFRTITSAHEMVDIDTTDSVPYAGVSDPLYASLSVVSDQGNVSRTSNTIDATIDTEVAGAYATKNGYNSLLGDYNTYYSSADALAGDMPNTFLPADPDSYIYVKWYVFGSAYGSQPYTLEMIDTAEENYGCIMLGIESDYEGVKKSDDGVSIRAKLFEGYTGGGRSTYVWTAYPKSNLTGDANMYKLQNTMKIIATGMDDKKTIEKEASSFVYVRLPITYTIVKNWDDNDNAAGRRPSRQAFKVERLYQGQYVHWNTLYAEDDGTGCYTCSWTDDRGINTYRVTETSNASGTSGSYYDKNGNLITSRWGYSGGSSYNQETHTWTFTNRYYTSNSTSYTQSFSKSVPWSYDDPSVGSTRNTAVNELMKGNPVYVTYSTGGSIHTYGDTVILEDGDYQFNGQNITSQDVDISSIRISKPSLYEYGAYDSENESWGSRTSIGYGNVDIYGLKDDTWLRYGQLINETLTSENGAIADDFVLTFPEGVTKFRAVCTSEADYLYMSASVTLRVKPSEYIMSVITNKFENSDSIRLSLSNIAYMKTEKNGEVTHTRSASETAYLHGRNYKVAANLSKSFNFVWNDVTDRVIQLSVSGTFTQQSNILQQADYISAIKSGVIPNTKTGTFYDLLPVGVVPDKNSIQLSNGDRLIRAYTENNFRNTGRTMLVMDVEFADQDGANSSSPAANGYAVSHTINFMCIYPWEEAFTYGFAGIKNIMAFGSDDDRIGTITGWEGEKDDASGVNHCQTIPMLGEDAPLLANLENRTTPSFVYASATMANETLDFYARTSFQKHVSVDDGNFVEDGTVIEDGNYTYRLFVQSATGTHSGDIIFLDYIDRCQVDGETQWKGTLQSIDLSEPRSLGVDPVVYYSTSENLDLDAINPSHEAGIVRSYLAENWTTQAPDDLSTVTAIAIDCGKDINGNDFVLPEDKGLMIYLHMRAASGDELTPALSTEDSSNPELNGHAYNKGWIDCYIQNDVDGTTAREYKASSITSVGIRAFNLHVEKEWNDRSNNDGTRPRAVDVELIRNGEHTGEFITLTQPEWKSEFSRIPQYDEQGVPYVYSLEEKAHDSEILLARENEGEWQEFNRISALGSTVPDDIKTAFNLSSPEFEGIMEEYAEGCMICRWKDGDRTIDIASIDGSGIDHYIPSVSIKDTEAVISNSHASESTTIHVEKTWDDALPNGTLMRPASIQVRLLANGKYTGDVRTIVERDGVWETDFVAPKYKRGKLVEYTVDEVPVEDFIVTYEDGGRKILNTYYPYGDLLITNTVRNGTEKALENTFTFVLQLTDHNGDDVTEKYVFEKGMATGKIGSGNVFTLKDGEVLKIKSIPATVHYTITEEYIDGFTVSVSENTEGVITSGTIQNVRFENTYSAKGQAGIQVFKELSGQALERNQFRFRLYQKENDILVGMASNNANGEINFNAQRYTEADDGKQYIYYMEEINAGKPAYTYADNRIYAIVNVEDNGDGTLNCNVETGAESDMDKQEDRYIFRNPHMNLTFEDGHVIYGAEWEIMTAEEKTEAKHTHGKYVETDSSVFYNRYSATGKVNLVAYKTIPGEMKQFGFVLHDLNGNVIDHAVNDSDGSIKFHELKFNESDIGNEYIYVVREAIPDESSDDPVIYDTTMHGYKIQVHDNKDGKLSFTQSNVEIQVHKCSSCSRTVKITFDGYPTGTIHVSGEADGLITPYGDRLPWTTIQYKMQQGECEYSYGDEVTSYTWDGPDKNTGFFKVVIGDKEYLCYPNETLVIPDEDCQECGGTGWIFEAIGEGSLPVFENTLKNGTLSVRKIAEDGTFRFHLELEGMEGTQAYQTALAPKIKVNDTVIPGDLHVSIVENGTGFGEWSNDRYVYHIPKGKFVHVKISSGNIVLFEGDTSKKEFTAVYPVINMDVELSVIDSVETEMGDIDLGSAVTLNHVPIIEGAERHEADITDGELIFTLNGGQTAKFSLPALTKYRIWEEQEDGWVLEYQNNVSGMIMPLQETEAVLTNVYRPEMASVTLMAEKTLQGQPTDRKFSFELLKDNTVIQTTTNSGKYIIFNPLTFTEEGTYEYEIREVNKAEEDIIYDERPISVTVTVTNDNGLKASVTYGRDAIFENDYYPGKLMITKWANGITNLNKDIQFDFNLKLEAKNGQEVGDKIEYYLVNATTGEIMQPDELTEYYTPQ